MKYGEAIPDDKDNEVVVATGEVLQEKKPESPSSVSLKIGIGTVSLVQIFAEKRPGSSEEIFAVLFSRNAGRSDHTPTG